MKLTEINQEIISLEFQFADATSVINPKVLLPVDPKKELPIPENVIARSKNAVAVSVELNKKLIALLKEREEVLLAFLPKQEGVEPEAKPDEN